MVGLPALGIGVLGAIREEIGNGSVLLGRLRVVVDRLEVRDELTELAEIVEDDQKRLRGYRAIGYARDEGPLNDDVGSGDPTVDDGPAKTLTIPISRKTHGPSRGRGPRRAAPPTRKAAPPTTAPWF